MTDRELMQQALDALLLAQRQITYASFEANKQMTDAFDALLARLSQPDWVRVEDGLPVVPEGQRCIAIWAFTSCVYEMTWFTYSTLFMPQVTHWRYFEQPKEPTC